MIQLRRQRCAAAAIALWLAVGAGHADERPAAPPGAASTPLAVGADLVTVWLAGDSTMAAKRPQKRPETGWGEALEPHFRANTVVIDNRAVNGRSTRTFITEGRWQALVTGVRAGDVVLLQFGHNDGSVEKPDRYTPLQAFRDNLAMFVADVRARRATPVLLTPVARRRFDTAGRSVDTHGDYDDAVREVAALHRVPLIDLEQRSRRILDATGDEASKRWYLWLSPGDDANYPDGVQDNTHFSPAGAQRMADEVVAELRALDLPLRALLVSEAAAPLSPSPSKSSTETATPGNR